MARQSSLKLVEPRPTTEQVLREALQAREQAMQTVRDFDALIATELRQLATERGVAFIRVETARRELLGQL